jgi:hypothetical protein
MGVVWVTHYLMEAVRRFQEIPEKTMPRKTINLWILIAFSVLVFAASAILAGRVGEADSGLPATAVVIGYHAVRAAIFAVAAYGLITWAGRTRVQALALVGLLGFVDQVVIKSGIMIYEMRKDPAYWEGISRIAVLFGIATSYLFFLPIVLILGFLGSFLAEDRAKKRLA